MKERLLEFLNSQGISQNAFEDTCGLSRGTISNLNKGVRSDKLALIACAFPEINLRWLLLGEGDMVMGSTNNNTAFQSNNDSTTVIIGNVDELAAAFAKCLSGKIMIGHE